MRQPMKNMLVYFYSWFKRVTGYELTPIIKKKSADELQLNGTGKKNLVVELIGQKACGKTTLINYFLKHNELKKSIVVQAYIDKIALQLKDANIYLTGNNSIYIDIIKSRTDIPPLGTISDVSGIDAFINKVKTDWIATNLYNNTVFLFDEHLSRRSKDIYLYIKDNDHIDCYLKNRLLVYCFPENIDDQISYIKRRGSKKINNVTNLIELTSDELRENLVQKNNYI